MRADTIATVVEFPSEGIGLRFRARRKLLSSSIESGFSGLFPHHPLWHVFPFHNTAVVVKVKKRGLVVGSGSGSVLAGQGDQMLFTDPVATAPSTDSIQEGLLLYLKGISRDHFLLSLRVNATHNDAIKLLRL